MRAVLYKDGLGEVNIQLANIFYIIADPLDMLGDEQQSSRAVGCRRILYERLDQTVEHAAVRFIERTVTLDDLPRGRGVLRGKGVKRVAQHIGGHAGHQRKIDIAVYLRLIIQND